MTLDQFPTHELLQLLTKNHFERLNLFSNDQLAAYSSNLSRALKLKFSIEKKKSYLAELIDEINLELKNKSISDEFNLFDFENQVKSQIEITLPKLNLKELEFSNQQALNFILELKESLYNLKDELKLLKLQLENTPFENWNDLIQNLYLKSNSHHKIFSEFENRLDYYFDNPINLGDIISNWINFYDSIPTKLIELLNESQKLHEVLVLYLEDEPIPKTKEPEFIKPKKPKQVLEIFEIYFKELEKGLNEDFDEIKSIFSEIDYGKKDTSINGIYRALIRIENELMDNSIFFALKKKEVLIKNFNSPNSEIESDLLFERKPDIKNLELFSINWTELKENLIESHKLMNGIFFEECPSIIFSSLFEKEKFIQPVNWIGKNVELYYLIKGIEKKFKHDDFWVRTNNCFLGKGKPLGKTSISNHKTAGLDPRDPKTLILDQVISLIKK